MSTNQSIQPWHNCLIQPTQCLYRLNTPPLLSQSNAERNQSEKPTVQLEKPSYSYRGYSAIAFVTTYIPNFRAGPVCGLSSEFPT
jgi:hypothetical protein